MSSVEKYQEDAAKVFKDIVDKTDLGEAARELLLKDLAKRHGIGLKSVRAEFIAYFDKLDEERRETKRARAANEPINTPEVQKSLDEIIARWGRVSSSDEPISIAAIPQDLDELIWPLNGSHAPLALHVMSSDWALVCIGGKVRYASYGGIRRGRGIEFLSTSDFVEQHTNRQILMGFDDEGKPKYQPLTSLYRQAPARTEFTKVTFCPECEGMGKDELNLFVGFGVKTVKGDWSLLRKHILNNLCRGNEHHFRWLMSWMAQIVQEPAQKLGTAVVLRGKKGTGKSKLGQWLRRIIGPHHALLATQARHVTGNFNAHLATCLLMVCEEAFWAGDKQAEGTLKSLITDDSVLLEKKGVDAIAIDNFTRLMIISNEKWVVPATEDERRFFVLEVGEAQMQNKAYFAAIDEQMENGGAEAMLHDLLHYGCATCAEHPSTRGYSVHDDVDLRNPPKTEGLTAQKIAGLTAFQLVWRDALIEGGLVDPAQSAGRHSFSTSGPTVVAKSLVAEAFGEALRKAHDKSTAAVTRLLKDLVPDLNSEARLSNKLGKAHAYRFPSLQDMRAAWTQKYGESPWPTELPTDAEDRDEDGNVTWLTMLKATRERNAGMRATWARENDMSRQHDEKQRRQTFLDSSEGQAAMSAIEVSSTEWQARQARQEAEKAQLSAERAAERASKQAVKADAAQDAHVEAVERHRIQVPAL